MMYASAKTYLDEALQQRWKEFKQSRVLMFKDDGSPGLSTVVSSPFSRATKQNTDRTVSTEGRFCHDLRDPVNTETDPATVPRVVLNNHKEVARCALRWKARCPGVSLGLAYRDVKGAFKRVWVSPEDVELMATDLPGDPAGFAEAIIAVFLVLTFGWTGSPGHWQAWAEAIRVWHCACAPKQAWRDGPEPFESFMVVDDGALVEPRLGDRQELSASTWGGCLTRLLGDQALNEEKKLKRASSNGPTFCGDW